MPRLSLIAKFSIVSLALFAVIGALLGIGLTFQFEQQAIEQQKLTVAAVVPPVVGPYLKDDLLANGAGGQSYTDIERALSYLGGSGLVRVRIWNSLGTVVYSDEANLVGTHVEPNHDFIEVLSGSTAAHLVPASSTEDIDQRGYGDLLHIYAPLRMAGKSDISAVFEGYYDAQDLSERIQYTDRFLWTGIGFGFLFLYTALFSLVYNASGKLTRQNEENSRLYKAARQRLAERLKAEEQMQRQVERLAALRNIDIAITSSLDLRVTLNVILEQVCTQLHVDAASLLLLDRNSMMLTYSSGRGFHSNAVTETSIRPGEGSAGRALLQIQDIGVMPLNNPEDMARASLLAEEEFAAYSVVPLIAKGQVNGVLEVFHRGPLQVDKEWISFMEALAGQAAIAVDNATLFTDLQHSNMSLAVAYDMTLEGWSRALDLRDEETEGHSRRVTEMTLKLARFMGMSEAALLHIRRGALLHDIGKMGIPDAILLKPGPLTDEEWAIMRKHPTYALELLSPIPFLKPALDIPYYHHEKWDGTGYPGKLKGEEIPFAARIFAIVDVWDALRSDRPYRSALPKEQAYSYIAQQSGKHFDPEVVDAFFRMQMPTHLHPQPALHPRYTIPQSPHKTKILATRAD
ncbi:MAG: HD domain-containing phosphohydrolase [Chloroflexota bacterium]